MKCDFFGQIVSACNKFVRIYVLGIIYIYILKRHISFFSSNRDLKVENLEPEAYLQNNYILLLGQELG